ncbi:uncharacterized protein LOC123703692 [Colias croceus]|uniref:uncharacterized protein LOC123703692 n=1 Tax=Colias crocea TaxID=72248 RepID=UPI001E27E800|nr:uncharacterized protein LOC123703692 [Colias croceus]
MKPQPVEGGGLPRESALGRCSVVLERISGATTTPTEAGGTVNRSYMMTDVAAESDSANSMASINSRVTMSPLACREALCTPGKESRFWRTRKRSRLDDGSSSDTTIPSPSGRPRTGLRKAHRVEKEAQSETETGASTSADPKSKTARSPSIALHTIGANTATEEVRKRIEANLTIVEKIAKTSNHLKSTYVADLRSAAKAIREDADSLAVRTLTEETSALRAENERLRIRLDVIQSEMRELRLLIHRGSVGSAQPVEIPEDFEARMVRKLGELIDTRLQNLQPRASPQRRHHLSSSTEGGRSRDIEPRKDSRPEVLKNTGPRPKKTKALSKLAQNVAQEKQETEIQKGGKKKKKKKGKGSGNESRAVELRAGGSTPAFSPATVVPSCDDAETLTAPTADPSNESWSVVTRKSRSDANKALRAGSGNTTVDTRKIQTPKPSQRMLKAPRSAAVVLTISAEAQANGVTYASAIKEARTRIDLKEAGIDCVKFRQAVTGATVIQIPGPGSGEKADLLANKLKALFKDNAIKVSRPVKMADLRVSSLDASVTADDLKDAIVSKGECLVDQIRISQIRKDRTGLYAAWVNCPVTVAKKLTETRFLVGWVAARVSVQAPREMRCFRCLEVGHVANRCTSECNRSHLCYRCGQPDHKAANCTAKPNCTVCTAAGRKADHRLGDDGCAAPNNRAPKTRPKRHTAGSQADGAIMEIVETIEV